MGQLTVHYVKGDPDVFEGVSERSRVYIDFQIRDNCPITFTYQKDGKETSTTIPRQGIKRVEWTEDS